MADTLLDWLTAAGLEHLHQDLSAQDVDLDVLFELTDAELADIGLSLGNRKRLLKAIETRDAAPLPERGTAEQAPVGESARRHVTVLFADLADFTKLSESLDPEEVHRILNGYFSVVDQLIAEYGGWVDKHIGDGVMAVFGAPRAHHNDAERAVLCALRIHPAIAALDPPLAAHIGIASGEVLASDTGSDTHVAYTVTGTSVNLAARLEGLAQTGETLVSESVHRQISDKFDCAALGEAEVQGISAPVKIWRIDGLKPSRGDVDTRPFIGRQAEIRQFQGLIDVCSEGGGGAVVLVRGEAGIGKTRLVDRFDALARASGFARHTGLVLDFGAGIAEGAPGALLRGLLGLTRQGTDANDGELIDALAETDATDIETAAAFDLLGLRPPGDLQTVFDALDDSSRRRARIDVMSRVMTAACGQSPLFIRIEDVHWADTATMEQIVALAQTSQTLPILVVLTTRHEGDPIDGTRRAMLDGCRFVTLGLGPLRPEEARALAAEYLETNDAFAKRCVERAAGNPLFLEQLVRSAQAEEVPGSVQSIVQARMDQLTPEDRRALRAASVLGQRFSLETLRAVGDIGNHGCDRLVEQHLIRPEGSDYLFAHALVREGVYQSILRDQRNRLHMKAAAWFDDKDVTLHADHLARAGAPEAVHAYLRAASVQNNAHRYDSVVALTDRGLALDGDASLNARLAGLKGRALLELGRVEESEAAFQAGFEMSTDAAERAESLIGLAGSRRIGDNLPGALEALSQAETILSGIDEPLLLGRLHFTRGNIHFPRGEIDACLASHTAALEAARQAGSPELEAEALGGLGDANYLRARMRSANTLFRDSIVLGERHGLKRVAAAHLPMAAWTSLFSAPLPETERLATLAVERCREISHTRAEIIALNVRCEVAIERGEMETLLATYPLIFEYSRKIGAPRFEIMGWNYHGRALLLQGKFDEARPLLQNALDASENFFAFNGPWILGGLIRCEADEETRRPLMKRCEAALAEGAVGHNYFFYYRDAIEVCLEQGDFDGARRYADALERFVAPEPVLWADFFVERTRALADVAEGHRDRNTHQRLTALSLQAKEAQYIVAGRDIDRALELLGN